MINKKDTHTRTGKKVLLFSSGMDSYIINELEKPDVLLFIDNKSNYSKLEMNYLKRTKHTNLVFVEDFINHSSIELDNMIIPGRNLYFVMIAAYFGEEIILGATAGDRSTDKDEKFARLASDLLSHMYQEQHWCTKGDIHVNLKYKSWTKEDLVVDYCVKNQKYGLSNKQSIDKLLEESFSCYHPTEDGEQCNSCKPDVRKWLAIYGATGIDTDYFYTNKVKDFFTPEVIKEWIQKEETGSRGRESEQIIRTLKHLEIINLARE